MHWRAEEKSDLSGSLCEATSSVSPSGCHLPQRGRLLDAIYAANLPGVSGAAAPRLQIVRGDLRAAGGGFFAAGSLSTRAKKVTLQILRPDVLCRFVPCLSFRTNRHKTQVKSGGGSIEGGACSPLNGRQPVYLHVPYSLPLSQPRGGGGGKQGSAQRRGSGRQRGLGRGGRQGFMSHSGRASRWTHTTRLPQLSSPSDTSANSPERLGFSIVTRRQGSTSPSGLPGPRSASNSGTRTQPWRSQPGRRAGYNGIDS